MTNSLTFLRSFLCLTLLVVFAAPLRAESVAKGTVFHDVNANGRLDPLDKPLPGIRVSNGKEIVKTDGDGHYQLQVENDAIVFVIKPAGWRTPLSQDNLPRFYYIHKPEGSPKSRFPGVEPTGDLPESIDFPLYPQPEPDQFKAILFGDPQPRNQQELDFVTHDVVEELIGSDAAFGVTLGDIVFDDLSLFGPQAKAIGLIGIPWYNVIGNHDINYDAKTDLVSDETFERHFGPAYYSFDYGPTHFVVLDNIEWYLEDETGKGRYRGGFGERQLAFVKQDLSLIPEEQLVVLMMHIPIMDTRNQKDLYALIQKRPNCVSISGHTHYHAHRFLTKKDGWEGVEPHHHIINVTVSGSWWAGQPDEQGLPHTMMRDGAPNGYSIMSFDGRKYHLDFKAARRPANYQIRIEAPEEVAQIETAGTKIFANVFNGSERSVVEMRIRSNKEWVKLERSVSEDPTFLRLKEIEKKLTNKTWRDLPNPARSEHLWTGTLPADTPPGLQLIEIRATDWRGRVVRGQRSIRVLPAQTAD